MANNVVQFSVSKQALVAIETPHEASEAATVSSEAVLVARRAVQRLNLSLKIQLHDNRRIALRAGGWPTKRYGWPRVGYELVAMRNQVTAWLANELTRMANEAVRMAIRPVRTCGIE